MRCPLCGLENPASAMRCDCGYNFKTGISMPNFPTIINNDSSSSLSKIVTFIGYISFVLVIPIFLAGILVSDLKTEIVFAGILSLVLFGILWIVLGKILELLISIDQKLGAIYTNTRKVE